MFMVLMPFQDGRDGKFWQGPAPLDGCFVSKTSRFRELASKLLSGATLTSKPYVPILFLELQ
jgi:hypothetical protein